MFEKEYKSEMDELHASEGLISDTLAKMQAEQQRLQVDKPGAALYENENVVALPRSRRVTRRRLLSISLPAAACLVLALVGALVLPRLIGMPEQGNFHSDEPSAYTFQTVDASASLNSGLQFSSTGQHPESIISSLKRAECPLAFLPAGLLDAPPSAFGDQAVYLGYDPQQQTYYAAYRASSSDINWTLLQSAMLDEDGFMKALQYYFAEE
ncbi:MAG: hypothetical protein FWH40_09830 [Coriobacteriia bacterium]|nr:hypothetical protein [Coriobacteriia bacterium]